MRGVKRDLGSELLFHGFVFDEQFEPDLGVELLQQYESERRVRDPARVRPLVSERVRVDAEFLRAD